MSEKGYEYIDVAEAGLTPAALSEIAGTAVRTIPVIIRGTEFIGGFVDLQAWLAA